MSKKDQTSTGRPRNTKKRYPSVTGSTRATTRPGVTSKPSDDKQKAK